MSFSADLKEELSKTESLANKEAVKYELLGYLISSNISEEKNKIKFSTENEYNINRFSRLLNNVEIHNYDITLQGKLFVITVSKEKINNIEYVDNLNTEQIKWLIRGIYLGAGSINNPEKKYHLEIGLKEKKSAENMKWQKNWDFWTKCWKKAGAPYLPKKQAELAESNPRRINSPQRMRKLP